MKRNYKLSLLLFLFSFTDEGILAQNIHVLAVNNLQNTPSLYKQKGSTTLTIFTESEHSFLISARSEKKKIEIRLFQLKKGKYIEVSSVVLKSPEELYREPVVEYHDSFLFIGCQNLLWAAKVSGNNIDFKPEPFMFKSLKGEVSSIYYDKVKKLLYIYQNGYFSSLPEMHEPSILSMRYDKDYGVLKIIDSFTWNDKFSHLESFITLGNYNLLCFKFGYAFYLHPFMDTIVKIDLQSKATSLIPLQLSEEHKPDYSYIGDIQSTLLSFSQINVAYKIREIVSYKSPSVMSVTTLNKNKILLILSKPDTLLDQPRLLGAFYHPDSGVGKIYDLDNGLFTFNVANKDTFTAEIFYTDIVPCDEEGVIYFRIQKGENVSDEAWNILARSARYNKMPIRKNNSQLIKCVVN